MIHKSCVSLKSLYNFSVITSKNQTYYPYLLSPDYELLTYSPNHIYRANSLRVDHKNASQIHQDTLFQFLGRQIKQDKTLFLKKKQFLFIGRSNSGKSSLINAAFQDKTIARKAKQPGTTKFLHFHHIKGEESFVVDAPGYGFAEMNKRRRQMWFGLVENYIKVSSRLSQIFLCVNFEHGLKTSDQEVLRRLSHFNVDIQVVMSKVDAVKPKKFMPQLQFINESIRRLQLSNINNRILACSAKNRFGVEYLRGRILEAIENSKQRNIDRYEDLLLEYIKSMRVSPIDLSAQETRISRPHVVRKLIYNSKLTKHLV